MNRKQLLTAFIEEVWSRGRIEACDDFIGEIYTVRHDPGDPWDGQTLSRDAFKERVRTSRAPFPDQRFEILSLFENDSSVAVTWFWRATHLGAIAGFPATGRPVTMSGATVYFFDEADRLTGHWQVADRLGVFRQLQSER